MGSGSHLVVVNDGCEPAAAAPGGNTVPAVAEGYGRPVTDTLLSTLRSALFITARMG